MKISIILATTAAAILTGAAAVALNAFQPMTDNDPTGASAHALTSLWEEFSKEQKADKPKSAAEVLKKIKEEASAKRLHSDFYDASVKYAEVLASVNWKERDALNEGARKEILAYDEPIVTFTWKVDRSYSSSTEVFRYVENEKGRLSASRTPYFHEGIGSVMGGEMRSFVENDYEYALWRLVITRNLNYDNPSQDEIYSTLSEYLGDRYPGKAYLEFYAAEKRPDYIAKGLMEKLAEKYSGKAVSFWPRQELLLMRKRELDKNSGTSAQYKALYDDCMAFEKEREALKGDERKIASGCIAVSNLIETLTAKSVSAEVVAGKIVVTFMNVDKADVKLYSIDSRGWTTAATASTPKAVRSRTCASTGSSPSPSQSPATTAVRCSMSPTQRAASPARRWTSPFSTAPRLSQPRTSASTDSPACRQSSVPPSSTARTRSTG